MLGRYYCHKNSKNWYTLRWIGITAIKIPKIETPHLTAINALKIWILYDAG